MNQMENISYVSWQSVLYDIIIKIIGLMIYMIHN